MAAAARVASSSGASSTSRPVPPRRRGRVAASAASTVATDAAQLAAGVVAGAALLSIAWPLLERELRPIRCARCRGMGWTVCANCKGRGKTGCPPLMYATVERRAKMRRSTASDDADSEVPIDGSCDGVMIAGPPRPREDAPTCADPETERGVRAGVGREAELLQGMRGQRAVRVRRVQPNGNREQLALRSSGERRVGGEGAVARPREPAPAPAVAIFSVRFRVLLLACCISRVLWIRLARGLSTC